MVISTRQTLSVAREVFLFTSYPLIQGGKLPGEVAGRARCLYFLMKSNLFVRVGKQKNIYIKQTFSLKGASKTSQSNPKAYAICACTNRSSLKEFQANVQVSSTIIRFNSLLSAPKF